VHLLKKSITSHSRIGPIYVSEKQHLRRQRLDSYFARKPVLAQISIFLTVHIRLHDLA
jgi:hypothetical protein